MRCPHCDAGTLQKIIFKQTHKIAYLCDVCMIFWFANDHVDENTGHALSVDEKDTFVFVQEEAEDSEEVQDEREREQYEFQTKYQ